LHIGIGFACARLDPTKGTKSMIAATERARTRFDFIWLSKESPFFGFMRCTEQRKKDYRFQQENRTG
jgi:hypothetical protein